MANGSFWHELSRYPLYVLDGESVRKAAPEEFMRAQQARDHAIQTTGADPWEIACHYFATGYVATLFLGGPQWPAIPGQPRRFFEIRTCRIDATPTLRYSSTYEQATAIHAEEVRRIQGLTP